MLTSSVLSRKKIRGKKKKEERKEDGIFYNPILHKEKDK